MRVIPIVLLTVMASLCACSGDAPDSTISNNDRSRFGYPFEVEKPIQLDVLMVIDNTGSMCRKQQDLREQMGGLFEQLYYLPVDFHMGITTTQMQEHAPEPVARPGHLQSTPQPIPGPEPFCLQGIDERGMPNAGGYEPLREAIKVAVGCMETPRPRDFEFSDEEIACAVDGTPAGCSIAAAGCAGDCTIEDLFPDPSEYRELPKVLRARDYEGDQGLDFDRLTADFACMSMVGTRGYEVEEGLAAAAAAVSPELTGGTVEAPIDPSAANHGFLRQNAEFGLYLMSDEGDCSNDGRLDVSDSACGSDLCYFSDAPLTPVAELKSRLIENLRISKSSDSDVSPMFVASIHANSERLETERPTEEECEAGNVVRPTCASTSGVGFSGHRYEEFLRQFPESTIYPRPLTSEPDAPISGKVCGSETVPFGVHPGATGSSEGCIEQAVVSCTDASDCPPGPFSEEAGECLSTASGCCRYCSNSVQVRAVGAESTLLESGYCIPESVGQMAGESQCTIDRRFYSMGSCGGTVGVFKVRWVRKFEAAKSLAGLELFMYEYGGEARSGMSELR